MIRKAKNQENKRMGEWANNIVIIIWGVLYTRKDRLAATAMDEEAAAA